jgi:nitrogen fixation protein
LQPVVTIANWDTNPQLFMHVPQPIITHTFFPEDFNRRTREARSLRSGLPGKLHDFVTHLLKERLVWAIAVRESELPGYATQIHFDVSMTLGLQHPFTAKLQPLLEVAESDGWAGPAGVDDTKELSLPEHPKHTNRPLTPELEDLGKRFTAAMLKLAGSSS